MELQQHEQIYGILLASTEETITVKTISGMEVVLKASSELIEDLRFYKDGSNMLLFACYCTHKYIAEYTWAFVSGEAYSFMVLPETSLEEWLEELKSTGNSTLDAFELNFPDKENQFKKPC